jgi:hypothetical protein
MLDRDRDRGDAIRRWRSAGGEFVIDYADPELSPAPVTTIAWRLAHLITGVFGSRAAGHFGGAPVGIRPFITPGRRRKRSGSSMTGTPPGWRGQEPR